MPPKKLKKFCRVTKFLEQTDKDLHQVLDDLCLFGLFRTRGRGVTFLYPSNAAYRKKISDHAYSNNPEKAVDMIKALVLLDYLPSPIDFKNKKDDIPNALHKKLGVDSADSKEVKLSSGHKLAVNKSFATLRADEPVAVYNITGTGELPLTGTSSTMKYSNTNNNKRTPTGGYLGGGALDKTSAIKLTQYVEMLYINGVRDIYRFVLGLIYEYVVKGGASIDKHSVYNRICASARASFYNIVSPWSIARDYNITTLLLESGITEMIDYTIDQMKTLVTSNVARYTDSLKNIIDVCGRDIDTTSRDIKRKELISIIKTPLDARTKVLDAYSGDEGRLYKDLLTVYCYLAAINEEDDETYFKNSFTYVMKHIFNHNNSFTESENETVYNLSMYYNLVKSDALLYTPVWEKSRISPDYTDLHDELPNPNVDELFTIQFNTSIINKRGGGVASDTFFGKVAGGLL
jgi:hypothetical protein